MKVLALLVVFVFVSSAFAAPYDGMIVGSDHFNCSVIHPDAADVGYECDAHLAFELFDKHYKFYADIEVDFNKTEMTAVASVTIDGVTLVREEIGAGMPLCVSFYKVIGLCVQLTQLSIVDEEISFCPEVEVKIIGNTVLQEPLATCPFIIHEPWLEPALETRKLV
eukprot:TRINITY_DN826_c0_g1_i1.p1 TRINITY_DN826_c0_g1~~TRINITY_DN826_c0_g1_i1.p1  ORF type:complete len:166 (+),score=27.06 TRINITY_DN826_c0_g1_i1:66-563(+)